MSERIHDVCKECLHECKKPWTFWSGMMSPWEYCENYIFIFNDEEEEEEEKNERKNAEI